jgi:hypothetical protein
MILKLRKVLRNKASLFGHDREILLSLNYLMTVCEMKIIWLFINKMQVTSKMNHFNQWSIS